MQKLRWRLLDPRTRTAAILGRFVTDSALDEVGSTNQERAIVLVEKTHFSPSFYRALGASASNSAAANQDEGGDTTTAALFALRNLGSNDVYTWMLGWMNGKPTSAAPTQEINESDEQSADAHVKLTLIRPASDAVSKSIQVTCQYSKGVD